MPTTIAVLSQKGGVGKSTISTNLACALQKQHGAKVLIVDTDSHVQSASHWRQQAGEDSGAPRVISISQPSVHQTLPALDTNYDYMVIDGLAHDHEMLTSSVKAADLVLIPIRPSAADFWGSGDLVELVQARQEITDGRPKAAFVVSQLVVGSNLAGDIDALLGHYPRIPVLEARAASRVDYIEAFSTGRSVIDYAPGSKAASEITDLTNETLSYFENGTL